MIMAMNEGQVRTIKTVTHQLDDVQLQLEKLLAEQQKLRRDLFVHAYQSGGAPDDVIKFRDGDVNYVLVPCKEARLVDLKRTVIRSLDDQIVIRRRPSTEAEIKPSIEVDQHVLIEVSKALQKIMPENDWTPIQWVGAAQSLAKELSLNTNAFTQMMLQKEALMILALGLRKDQRGRDWLGYLGQAIRALESSCRCNPPGYPQGCGFALTPSTNLADLGL